jgi:hypothetical protein
VRGRIRQLKPDLFLDEEFWALTEEHLELHLLQAFEGLWCQADREGRFEWRPAMLKTQILPYWGGDFARVLEVLRGAGYVCRYEVAGRSYGLIKNFHRHQRPNNREPESVIPPPPLQSAEVSLESAEAESASPLEPAGFSPARVPTPTPNPNSQLPTPDTQPARAQPEREPLPHELAEARAAAEPTGARPALRFEFRPDWRPKTTHRDLARSLGLTDEEVGERLHDCRNKTYPTGFRSEDKQFNRELAWAARDKETRTFKAQQLAARKANPHGFDENPGARRRPDDPRPEPVFGRISAG